jgi:hypothetical protein
MNANNFNGLASFLPGYWPPSRERSGRGGGRYADLCDLSREDADQGVQVVIMAAMMTLRRAAMLTCSAQMLKLHRSWCRCPAAYWSGGIGS